MASNISSSANYSSTSGTSEIPHFALMGFTAVLLVFFLLVMFMLWKRVGPGA